MKHLILPDAQCKPGVSLEHLSWAGKYAALKRPDVIVCIEENSDKLIGIKPTRMWIDDMKDEKYAEIADKRLKAAAESMARIKTSEAAKALWPGIKEWFEKEYSTDLFLSKKKEQYCHININDKVDTLEDAQAYVEILNDTINILAVNNPVYVRKEPTALTEDYGRIINVRARFSVGDPKIVGKVGIIHTKVYDDE